MVRAALHGFLLAMPLIVPLGVQNIFVFNQGALQPKFVRTLPVVITASICDTLLISLAVMGVSTVVLNYLWLKSLMSGLGVLFLAFMGWNTWRSVPDFDANKDAKAFSRQKQITFAASVSLLNPHAIVDTVVVIGTNSLQYEGWDKVAFALACITVSWVWFFTLAWSGKIMGSLDKTGHLMVAVNQISALFMWGAALYIIKTFF